MALLVALLWAAWGASLTTCVALDVATRRVAQSGPVTQAVADRLVRRMAIAGMAFAWLSTALFALAVIGVI